MTRKPGVQSDNFLGDLINAITLRPVYRPSVEAPVTKQETTAQPAAEPVTTAVQQEVQEEEQSTATTQQEAQEESITATVQQTAQENYLDDPDIREYVKKPLLTRLRAGIRAFGEAYDAKPGQPVQEQAIQELGTLTLDLKQTVEGNASPNPASVRLFPSGRQGHFGRLFRSRLSSRDLIKLGFSKREARILEGMSHGKSTFSIAHGLGMKESEVQNTIKRMMNRFGVSKRDDLLRTVHALHTQAFKRHYTSAKDRLKTVVTDPITTAGTRTIHAYDIMVKDSSTPAATGEGIPKGHPDHPLSVWKRGKEEGKRTRAHSTDTPSPKQHPPA